MATHNKTNNGKTEKTPLPVGMINKREFLAWLRLRGVLYSNAQSVFRLGYFVLCFMDDGYLVAYTPTPAALRDTFVSQITNLVVFYNDPEHAYKKLERYHLMLFKTSLKLCMAKRSEPRSL